MPTPDDRDYGCTGLPHPALLELLAQRRLDAPDAPHTPRLDEPEPPAGAPPFSLHTNAAGARGVSRGGE